ncbi:MAG: DNA/RNA non-specific endonuclease [Treponema sp.]|nr:DNA/RNA non-specific endonuclease [Treponema sp.]MCL2252266.1 DNA/RNA non-specific endonuclease [Treponema sp.]
MNAKLRINRFVIFFLFLFLTVYSFACDLDGHFNFNVSDDNDEILYAGCYDAINMGPHIIEYILTKERLEGDRVTRPYAMFTQNRDGGILMELLAEHGYSLPHHRDFRHSGYDRGHMAPNADFNNTYENALLTFFIGNIWPQTPDVNRIEWLKTENETRKLALKYSFIRIIIIVDEFSEEKINEKISIPLCFKKRVYDLYTGNLIYEIDVYQRLLTGEDE